MWPQRRLRTLRHQSRQWQRWWAAVPQLRAVLQRPHSPRLPPQLALRHRLRKPRYALNCAGCQQVVAANQELHSSHTEHSHVVDIRPGTLCM